MNTYLIKVKNKRYITNADSSFEAEQRFLEEGMYEESFLDYTVKEIELTPKILADESIVYF